MTKPLNRLMVCACGAPIPYTPGRGGRSRECPECKPKMERAAQRLRELRYKAKHGSKPAATPKPTVATTPKKAHPWVGNKPGPRVVKVQPIPTPICDLPEWLSDAQAREALSLSVQALNHARRQSVLVSRQSPRGWEYQRESVETWLKLYERGSTAIRKMYLPPVWQEKREDWDPHNIVITGDPDRFSLSVEAV